MAAVSSAARAKEQPGAKPPNGIFGRFQAMAGPS